MTEERITEHTDAKGNTHTTRTIVTDGGTPRRRDGSKILLVIIAVIAVFVAFYFLSNMSDAEVAKDNAIGEAAGEVGDAADQAGDAIQDAADRVAPE